MIYFDFRNGMGTCTGSNFSKHGISQLQGPYQDGILHGYGSVKLINDNIIEGLFCNGYLVGPCVSVATVDFNRPSDLCNIDFKSYEIACYKKGLPYGYVWHSLEGGGWLHGKVDEKGKFTGNEIMFVYPDFHMCLIGRFQDGIMKETRLSFLESITFDGNILVAVPCKQIFGTDVFSYSPASPLGVTVQTADPYETARCSIQPSCIPGAGEGLFAKVDIPAGQIVSFYHGAYFPYGAKCDNTNCDYQIFLDWKNAPKSDFLDIPEDCISTENYCASLAHKANHSFSPNCEFIRFYHPRYCGQSLAIRTMRDILSGEEFTVHYKYDIDDAPSWFLQLCRTSVEKEVYYPVANYHAQK